MGSPHLASGRPRAALIGGGFIGPVHAEALGRIGVGVVGILGSSPERAQPIAERLGISDHTAKFHVNAVLQKLGAQTRTEAVVRAARLGLVTL